MKALLLAAGTGRRLRPLTKDIPTCLVRVNGVSILERQLTALERSGIRNRDVVIVTGYKAEKIRESVDSAITLIYNPEFERTNSLYSLWMAGKEDFSGGFILMNADIVFDDLILRKLLKRNKNCIAVDFRCVLHDGEMNVVTGGGRVRKIGKDIPAGDADGESVQLIRFDSTGSRIIFEKADEAVQAGLVHGYPSDLLQYVIAETGLDYVDVEALPWIEVDFPEDLVKAEKLFKQALPAKS